jgi:hypothetical protein
MASRQMQFVRSRALRGFVPAICGLLAVAVASYGQERPAPRITHGQPTPAVVSRRQSSPLVPAGVTASYLKLPLAFEANQGQTDQQVKFLSRGRGYTLFLTSEEAVLTLQKGSRKSVAKSQKERTGEAPDSSLASEVLRMKLAGANANARVVGLDELPGKSHYFIGNDPRTWRTNVPNYGKVRYEGVYPGIDLVYHGNQQQLEYDFVVSPGADPRAIALQIETGSSTHDNRSLTPGPSSARRGEPEELSSIQPSPLGRGWSAGPGEGALPRIDASGDLVIATQGGEVRFHKPVVYQEQSAVSSRQSAAPTDHGQQSTDRRKYVDGRFALRVSNPKSKIENPKYEVSFELVSYDPALPLVIDPVLSYATYLGGIGSDSADAIAVDSNGNAYLTGFTNSADFPTASPLYGSLNALSDVFVTKMSADGSLLVYSTYLGGNDEDYGRGIAVDSSGNAYVTGYTYSTDFPTASAFQGALGGVGYSDAFVTKLSAAGDTLLYSSYLGGSLDDLAYGIALDSFENAYVTGYTQSTNFPTTNPMQASNAGLNDAFVTKVSATGSAKVYSTYLGGTGFDVANAIAVDSSGNAYITGATSSTDFPTTNPIQGSNGGTSDNAFITKLNATGDTRLYSTYLGGSSSDYGTGIAVDSSGNAYVLGLVTSLNFPTVNLLQLGPGGGQDIFVSKINTAGTSQVYTAILGGSGYETGAGIARDLNGSVYVTGYSGSTDYPLASPLQGSLAGGVCEGTCTDIVLSKINAAGNALIFSTYLGGDGEDYGYGLGLDLNPSALDVNANAYVVGATEAANFPVTPNPGAFQTTCNAALGSCNDAVVIKFSDLALPVYYASPTSLDFGSVGVGVTSAERFVTLENRGDATLNITSVVASDNFAVSSDTCGSSLGAGSSCSIGVTLTPSATGPIAGTLKVTDSAYLSPHFVNPLSGTGIPVPIVGFSVLSLDFGSQQVGTTSASKRVTLTNTGTAVMTISGISPSGDFGAPHDCPLSPATLAIGASCNIDVTFSPKVAGPQAGELRVYDDAPAPGSSQVVLLSGTGTVSAVRPDHQYYYFGALPVGSMSAPQTVTLTNTGTASLVIGKVVPSRDFAVASETCTAGSIGVGANCGVDVTFTPTADGRQTGALTIDSNAPDSPTVVGLIGASALRLLPEFTTNVLPANDDDSTGLVPLPFAVNFFGRSYSGLYVNNNGNVTFDVPLSGFTPFDLTSTSTVIIAPFFADVDTEGIGSDAVTCGVGTVDGRQAFGVNWINVGYFSSHADKLNSFQLVLINRSDTGPGNFDIEFNYALTQWETGDANGGSGGLGGASARAGYSNGTGSPGTFFELSGSAVNGAFLDSNTETGLIYRGRNGRTGLIVRGGQVVALSISPTRLSFPDTPLNTDSSSQTITVTNTNPDPVTITSIVASGDFIQTNTCGSGLDPGASCTIRVRFHPTAYGTTGGTITITSNATGSPHVVTLTGSSTAPTATVSISPASLNFPDTPLNVSSPTQAVTVTNAGAVDLVVASVDITAPFSQTNTCGSPLAAGQSCVVSVGFTPTVAGPASGVLTITSNASGSPHTVTLTGSGTPATTTTAVSVSPASVNFPGNPLNLDCPTRPVTITNTGTVNLVVSSVSIAVPFSQTNTCASPVPPRQSCVVDVLFKPTVVGTTSGTLTITSNAAGSPHTVAVTGNGTPPCLLLTQVRTATVLRGTESANFNIKDRKPSCSPTSINLTCTPDNPASCALNPTVIPPSGASTLKVSNLRAVAAASVRVVVNSTSEFRTASEAVTVLLADFAFASAPDVASVAAGGTASYALAIRPINGLAGSVSLACSGAPQGATCAVTPASVTLDGVSLVSAKLTVTTTARATAPGAPFGWPPLAGRRGLFLLALLALGTLAMLAMRRRRGLVVLAAAGLMLLGWAACGGGGGSMNFSSGGTPAGTYALKVTGTYTNTPGSTPASLTNSTTVTLKVN